MTGRSAFQLNKKSFVSTKAPDGAFFMCPGDVHGAVTQLVPVDMNQLRPVIKIEIFFWQSNDPALNLSTK
jgi:hypothetical protein